MNIIQIVGVLIAAYLLVEWVLPWFWYPHLKTRKPATDLPEDLRQIIDKYNRESEDDLEFLKKVMDLIKSRYKFDRFYMYFFPVRWFETNLEKIWNDTNPQLCSISNYLLEGILFYSGRFTEDKIGRKTTFANFSLHQYVEVTTKGGKKVVLDPWAYGMGVPFGKKVFGFV